MLLVNLIYRLVAYVTNILHIIAELKKTEKMNSIGELLKKATEIISGHTINRQQKYTVSLSDDK